MQNVTVTPARAFFGGHRGLVLWSRPVDGRSLAHPTASNQRVDGRLPPAHVPKHRWGQHLGLCGAAKTSGHLPPSVPMGGPLAAREW